MDAFDFDGFYTRQVVAAAAVGSVTDKFNQKLSQLDGADIMDYMIVTAKRQNAIKDYITNGGEKPELVPFSRSPVTRLLRDFQSELKTAYLQHDPYAYTCLPLNASREPAVKISPAHDRENMYLNDFMNGAFAATGPSVADYIMRAASGGHGMQVDGLHVTLYDDPVSGFDRDGNGILSRPVGVYTLDAGVMDPMVTIRSEPDTGAPVVHFGGEWVGPDGLEMTAGVCCADKMARLYFENVHVSCGDRNLSAESDAVYHKNHPSARLQSVSDSGCDVSSNVDGLSL